MKGEDNIHSDYLSRDILYHTKRKTRQRNEVFLLEEILNTHRYHTRSRTRHAAQIEKHRGILHARIERNKLRHIPQQQRKVEFKTQVRVVEPEDTRPEELAEAQR